jgi:hypothetical protein
VSVVHLQVVRHMQTGIKQSDAHQLLMCPSKPWYSRPASLQPCCHSTAAEKAIRCVCSLHFCRQSVKRDYV